MLDRFFCYGTLQSPEILRAVIGRNLTSRRASLDGYACYRISGECYPGLVPAASHRTNGVVYLGLTRREMMLLDRYEGLLYQRKPVEVIDTDGTAIKAWTYVVKTAHYHRVTCEPWSLDEFESDNLSGYLRKI